jgi:molybdopterin-binding protein
MRDKRLVQDKKVDRSAPCSPRDCDVSDKVSSECVIKTAAGTVTSIITTGSVKRMNLSEGDSVFAIIKATELSVEKE